MSVAGYQGRGILITGASGYIAGCLVQALGRTKCLVRRFSRSPLPAASAPIARLEDCSGDPLSLDIWQAALSGIDIVFHCAGQTSVYAADRDPQADLAANAGITIALLNAARLSTTPITVILASTATIVGLPSDFPIDETSPVHPVTAYDSSKLAAEHYLALGVRLGHVHGGALRLANVYGPGPNSGSADRGVLNKIVAKSLRNEPVQVFSPGNWLRDYIFIEDVVDAFLKAGLAGPALAGRPFYLCTGTSHTLIDAFREAVAAAFRHGGQGADPTWIEPPPGLSPIEFRNFVGQSDLFQAVSGWRPRISLREGLDRTAAALLPG